MSWPTGERLAKLAAATAVWLAALATAFDVVLPLGVRAVLDVVGTGRSGSF